MEFSLPSGFDELVDKLREMNARASVDGVSHHFLEFVKTDNGNTLSINGNPDGLIYFAMSILEVVKHRNSGSHAHFDEVGIVDRADIPIVVCLKEAPWSDNSISETIYIRLLNEGTTVYRPVPASQITSNIYILNGADIYDPEVEEWEFVPGSRVIVEKRQLEKGEVLVAVAKD